MSILAINGGEPVRKKTFPAWPVYGEEGTCNLNPDINVVLVEPEIPQNTGAAGRLCVGLGARLHLIKPFGFVLTDAQIKRCGLDYWDSVDLREHDSWQDYLDAEKPGQMILTSTRGRRSIYDCSFKPGVHLVFGSEHKGFPSHMYETYADRLYRIPMPGENARSINLANAAAIVAYEAYRQISVARALV